jgi:hypothetical protein
MRTYLVTKDRVSAMKLMALFTLVFIATIYCSASQRAESSTDFHKACSTSSDSFLQNDFMEEVRALIESKGIKSTLDMRKFIQELKAVEKKGASSESIFEITQCLKSLRIRWAKVLLESAHVKVPHYVINPDEVIECIEELSLAIESVLVPLQKSWNTKESHEKKGRAVQKTLTDRQQEIDDVKEEEKRWETRCQKIDAQIEQGAADLPLDVLQLKPADVVKKNQVSSSALKANFTQAQEHLNKILSLLQECKEISLTALRPLPENLIGIYDDDYLDEQANLPTNIVQDVDNTYLAVSRRVVWDINNQLQEKKDIHTLEEIQNEHSQLLSELHDRAHIALHTAHEYRNLCRLIQSNRETYVNHRVFESESFKLLHARLQEEHEEYVLLKARLKLFLPLAFRTQNELLLEHSEIKILEHHKSDLLPQERDALGNENPSLWMRMKNYFG